MKLIAALCLAWSLYGAADALMCVTCMEDSDVQCSITASRNCSEGEVCLTGRLESNVGPRIIRKRCIPKARCGKNPMNTPFQILHTNLGQGNGIIAGLCCDTHDNCNSENQKVTEDVQNLKPNGLRCFTCNGPFDITCHRTFECMGLRTRCVRGLMIVPDNRFQAAIGCVSQNWCDGINLHLTFFSPLITLSAFVEGPHCCNDRDFCNGNSSVLPPELVAATILPMPRFNESDANATNNTISRETSAVIVSSSPSMSWSPLVMMLWFCALLTLAMK